jgi:hypothetical protein
VWEKIKEYIMDAINYVISTVQGQVDFKGVYREDLQTANWHYYESENGHLLHFRKEHMVCVESWGKKK